MNQRKFFSVVGASLLFLHAAHAQGDGIDTGFTQSVSVQHASCLSAFNEARKAVGFSPFTENTEGYPPSGLESCRRVQEGLGGYDAKLTYFYARQTGDAEDCGAAVALWRSGVAAAGNKLPPAYTKDAEIYKLESFLGLVGLFNPNQNPIVECSFVKCPGTTGTSFSAPAGGGRGNAVTGSGGGDAAPQARSASPTGPSPKGRAAPTSPGASSSLPEAQGRNRRLSAAKTDNALVCRTFPRVLVENEKPFNQEQWDKIAGTASAPSPSAATAPAFSLLALPTLAMFTVQVFLFMINN